MKHWVTRFDTYDAASLHLVICKEIALAQREFKEVRDPKYTDSSRGLAVCRWPHFFIFLSDPAGMTHRVIAHEIFHTTMELMRNVEVKINTHNDEAHAYILDWATGWVYSKLKGRRIRTGHQRKIS